jgi:ribosomal protein L3 glutamine methyltransferase
VTATRTVRALLAYGIRKFETAGLSYGHGTTNALDEAAWLVLHATGFPLDELNAHLDEPLTDARYTAAKRLIERRVRTRKPAAYLTNEAWLGKHRFYVDERVIVPRSFISEWLLAKIGDGPHFDDAVSFRKWGSVPDFGSLHRLGLPRDSRGAGFSRGEVDAADLSDDALAVAKRNVADYRLGKRVRLVKSDLLAALEGRTYDLIISNPPYVKAASMRKLPEEYRKEPEMALASGSDGLEHTRAILRDAARHLNPGGMLAVEIGHNRKALERAFPRLASAGRRRLPERASCSR